MNGKTILKELEGHEVFGSKEQMMKDAEEEFGAGTIYEINSGNLNDSQNME